MAKQNGNGEPEAVHEEPVVPVPVQKTVAMQPITTASILSPASIQQTIEAIDQIRKFAQSKLNVGVDYDIIPGTKKKTLFQPGAEKLAMYLLARPEYVLTAQEIGGDGHIEYDIVCTLYSQTSGQPVGQGLATASTMETKYRYRWLDEDDRSKWPDWSAAGKIHARKQKQLGLGRWSSTQVKGKKEWVWQTKMENPNIWDERHTVKMMGAKRAFVKGVRTMAGVSEIFTQDLEDKPEFQRPASTGGSEEAAAAAPPPTQEQETKRTDPKPKAGDKPEKKSADKDKGSKEKKKSSTRRPKGKAQPRSRAKMASDLTEKIGCNQTHMIAYVCKTLGVDDIRNAASRGLTALLEALEQVLEKHGSQKTYPLVMDEKPEKEVVQEFNKFFGEGMKKK